MKKIKLGSGVTFSFMALCLVFGFGINMVHALMVSNNEWDIAPFFIECARDNGGNIQKCYDECRDLEGGGGNTEEVCQGAKEIATNYRDCRNNFHQRYSKDECYNACRTSHTHQYCQMARGSTR